MPSYKIACPGCGQHVECDESHSGIQTTCPTCGCAFTVPPPAPMATVVPSAISHRVAPPPRPVLAASPRLTVASLAPASFPASMPVVVSSPPRPPRSLLAVASLGLALSIPILFVVGIMFVLVWLLIPPVLVAAILCGHFARMQIRRNPGTTGRALAATGLVIGYGYIGLTVLVLLVLALFARDLLDRLIKDMDSQRSRPHVRRAGQPWAGTPAGTPEPATILVRLEWTSRSPAPSGGTRHGIQASAVES